MREQITWGAMLPFVDLTRLVVPLDRCLRTAEGPIDRQLIEEATASGFSQVVLQATGAKEPLHGLVPVERLSELQSSGMPLVMGDAAVDRVDIRPLVDSTSMRDLERLESEWASEGTAVPDSYRLREMAPKLLLGELLRAFDHRTAVLVRPSVEFEDEDGSPQWYDRGIAGILTLSDLNRHPLRAQLYPVLAELEVNVAELVKATYPSAWDWVLTLTSEDSRARIVGYWKLAEREDVDVGAEAGATLSELLRAVGRDDELRKALGYGSRKSFDAATSSLHRVRNLIMHPVRPLVQSTQDCHQLAAALTVAARLSARAKVTLEASPPELL